MICMRRIGWSLDREDLIFVSFATRMSMIRRWFWRFGSLSLMLCFLGRVTSSYDVFQSWTKL